MRHLITAAIYKPYKTSVTSDPPVPSVPCVTSPPPRAPVFASLSLLPPLRTATHAQTVCPLVTHRPPPPSLQHTASYPLVAKSHIPLVSTTHRLIPLRLSADPPYASCPKARPCLLSPLSPLPPSQALYNYPKSSLPSSLPFENCWETMYVRFTPSSHRAGGLSSWPMN